MSSHAGQSHRGTYQPRRKAAPRARRRGRGRAWFTFAATAGVLAAATGGIASASPFGHHRFTASNAGFSATGFSAAAPAAGQQTRAAAQNQAGQNQAFNQNQATNPNQNCTLIVPADPLSAQGLASPYQLIATDRRLGPCHEANAMQSAFVEAAILAPGGQITLYDPLVVDFGAPPAAQPAPAQVPSGATVGIWFGFNGMRLTLRPAFGTDALDQGACVNGAGGSVFGQFAYCNAPAFFEAAKTSLAAGSLTVPPLGTASDGLPCPTTRDFSVVDQDQSDNVVTHYLATGFGLTAQNTAADRAALPGAVDLANASDNLLLSGSIDPALGCAPFTAPNQSSDNQPTGALPLDELSAAANQQAPIALVPLNDPMTMVAVAQDNNALTNAAPMNVASFAKDNLYRAGVDQPLIDAANGAAAADTGDGAAYCRNLFAAPTGVQRVFNDRATFQRFASPNAMTATNLFTFLAMRANQSFTNLGCANLLGVPNPVALRMAGNIVVDAFLLPLGQRPADGEFAVPQQQVHW